jgi:uncharacterized protein (DUF2336 family)
MFESGPTPLPFLSKLAASRDGDAKRLVLRIAVDQFMARAEHVAAAIKRFEDEIETLIAEAGDMARASAARKLCAHSTPPARILDAIGGLGGEGALVVLTHARTLSRQRLEAAAAGESANALALARRDDLDADLVAALVARNERAIALTLARNPSAPLGPAVFARWTPAAERDEELARAVLARAAPSLDQARLFFVATPEQRLALLAAAQRSELAAPRTAGIAQGAREATAMLEGLALRDQEDLFITALSLGLRCAEELARKITREASGEALALALAALEVPRETAVRILISGDIRAGAGFKRIGALVRLKDALSPAAARRFIAAMAEHADARRARYSPQHDPTAAPAPGRAGAIVPAGRDAPAPETKIRTA